MVDRFESGKGGERVLCGRIGPKVPGRKTYSILTDGGIELGRVNITGWIYIIYIYMHIHTYMCVCVCVVCMCM